MEAFTPTALKLALVGSGQRQFVIAKRAKMSGPRLSVLASGHEHATPDEKKALAKALRCPVDQLFPEALSA